MDNQISTRAKEILSKVNYLTIATVTPDGKPWNSPVFGICDDNYYFYFGTHKDSQKAKNISVNNQVFVIIYDSTVPPGSGEGVYIQGTAAAITNTDEIKQVRNLLKNHHEDHFWDIKALSENGPISLYKITPHKVWMNDGSQINGHYIDTRTKIQLVNLDLSGKYSEKNNSTIINND